MWYDRYHWPPCSLTNRFDPIQLTKRSVPSCIPLFSPLRSVTPAQSANHYGLLTIIYNSFFNWIYTIYYTKYLYNITTLAADYSNAGIILILFSFVFAIFILKIHIIHIQLTFYTGLLAWHLITLNSKTGSFHFRLFRFLRSFFSPSLLERRSKREPQSRKNCRELPVSERARNE